MITTAQRLAALDAVLAVSEAIRTAGEIPAGTIYAMLCDRVGLEAFERMVKILVGSKMVQRRGDLLVWVGPHIEEAA